MIAEGRCIFFGPRERAKAYFQELGFECPPRQTTADFLTSITDPHSRVIKKGFENTVPKTAEAAEQCFRDSREAKSNYESIASFESEVQQTHQPREAGMTKRFGGVYSASFLQQVQACTTRQYQVLWGDKKSFIGKYCLITFQALIVGSLFHNQPATSNGVFTRGGILL